MGNHENTRTEWELRNRFREIFDEHRRREGFLWRARIYHAIRAIPFLILMGLALYFFENIFARFAWLTSLCLIWFLAQKPLLWLLGVAERVDRDGFLDCLRETNNLEELRLAGLPEDLIKRIGLIYLREREEVESYLEGYRQSHVEQE